MMYPLLIPSHASSFFVPERLRRSEYLGSNRPRSTPVAPAIAQS